MWLATLLEASAALALSLGGSEFGRAGGGVGDGKNNNKEESGASPAMQCLASAAALQHMNEN